MSALPELLPAAAAATDALPPLLRASIVAGDRNDFAISFESDLRFLYEDVFVRFALHYYARALYELSHTKQLRALPEEIETIVRSTVGGSTDLFALAGLRGSLASSVATSIGEAHLTLRRCPRRRFELDGALTLSGRPLARSVIAVIQKLSGMMTADGISSLCTALANMNASYTMTHRFGDPASLHEVPDIAFLASAFA